jgi:hypothetical protein
MKREIRIYVVDAAGDDVLKVVKEELAGHYGGFTAMPAKGGWVDNDDELIEEAVTVVSAAARSEDAPHGSVRSHARALAQYVRDEAGEDAVLWQIVDSNHGLSSDSGRT